MGVWIRSSPCRFPGGPVFVRWKVLIMVFQKIEILKISDFWNILKSFLSGAMHGRIRTGRCFGNLYQYCLQTSPHNSPDYFVWSIVSSGEIEMFVTCS